ncbi:MAG TPA: hypothetical protein PKJ37_06885 [Acidobacteriota bacterium]|nr:hypothetical protein [Acidobacteriota bacterium]HNT17601.1 hypothetical protein [Acidobacteriota bacterium]
MPVSFIVLAVFFVFTSFAFGCMENWSIATAEVILFLGAGISGYLNRDFWSFPKRLKAFALFVLVLIVVAVVQLIPLPVSFWNFADKDRIVAYEEGLQSEELLQSEKYRTDPFGKTVIPAEAERYTPKAPGWLTISRAPFPTAKALVALLAFFCFILMLEDVMKEGTKLIRRLGTVAGICGLAIALIALVEKGMENRTHILWMKLSDRASEAFGPFVNGNHGQAFINITFPLLYYLLWRKSKNTQKMSDRIGMRSLVFGLMILQGSLVISGSSRGNVIALVMIPLIYVLHLALSKKSKIAFAAAAAFFLILIAGSSFLLESGLLVNEVRIGMNRNILPNLTFCGTGLGTFEEVFPSIVTDWPLYKSMHNEFLENEYLQLLLETGAATPFILLLILAAIVMVCYGALEAKGSTFWLVVPLVSEALRAWVDMSFHVIPIASAYILVYALMASRRN